MSLTDIINKSTFNRSIKEPVLSNGLSYADRFADNKIQNTALPKQLLSGSFGNAKQIPKNITDQLARDSVSRITSFLPKIGSQKNISATPQILGENDLGNSLAGLGKRGDAIPSWSWFVLLPTIGSINLPWYYIQKTNFPQKSFSEDTLVINSHNVSFPSGINIDDLEMEFFLDTKNAANDYLNNWISLVAGNSDSPNNQGNFGLPSLYKKTIQIVVQSAAKETIVVSTYDRCWPLSRAAIDLNSESSVIAQSVTFKVEDVKVDLYNTALNTTR